MTAVDYSDSTPDVTYGYDADNNRTSMTDGSGSVGYTYDNLNRLTGVARGTDSFAYAYDAAGNVTSRIFPGSITSSYTFDNEERLASATTASATTSYSYDAAGNVTQTTLPSGNGYAETREYDHAGRLVDVTNAGGSNVLSAFAATLDGVGNPTRIDRTGATTSTQTYGYDASDRLTSVCFQTSCPNSTDPRISWTYDKVGNRLSETRTTGTVNYTYNADDELTQAGSTSYGYDANGNELTAGADTYTYDLANRTSSVNDGSTTTDYTYDGDGLRLSASAPSATSNYAWDVDAADGFPQIAVERNGVGTLIRSYAYGARRISMRTGSSVYFYHYDVLGSVANLTSATGASEWTYDYEPFGTTRSSTKNDPSAPDNEMRFLGEQNDGTATYNLRARQYDVATGRMLGIDPAGSSPGVPSFSTYIYANDRPTVMQDPSGATAIPTNLGMRAAENVTSPPPTDLGIYNDVNVTSPESAGYYGAIGVAFIFDLAAKKCLENPACSGWGTDAWNFDWLHRHHLVQNKARLPIPDEGQVDDEDHIFFRPRKRDGGEPYFDNERGGWLDDKGRAWKWDRSGHRGQHWDVQIPGGHINVHPEGRILR